MSWGRLPYVGWTISRIPDESGITHINETSVEFPGMQSGTWTPRLSGDTGGTVILSPSSWGKWLKIGNYVKIDGIIIVQDVRSLIGQAVITGFPFNFPDAYIAARGYGFSNVNVKVGNLVTNLTDNQNPTFRFPSWARSMAYMIATDTSNIVRKPYFASGEFQEGTFIKFSLDWIE